MIKYADESNYSSQPQWKRIEVELPKAGETMLTFQQIDEVVEKEFPGVDRKEIYTDLHKRGTDPFGNKGTWTWYLLVQGPKVEKKVLVEEIKVAA